MEPTFAVLDYVVFAIYGLVIVGLGLFVSREKKGHTKNSTDYFLAGKSLPFWAIGASLIASNISAEQFIGMSGSGFRIGLAIASYEWMAAVTLLVIAYFFLPIYLKKGIYTMPQFLELRYDSRVRNLLAVFWIIVYIFVNLTSVLYLGSLALNGIMGVPVLWGIAGLAAFATLYSIYGGLKAVAWTDVVQVVVLVGGGLLTTYFALNAYSDGAGAWAGFTSLLSDHGDRFNLILSRGDITYVADGETRDAFDLLPGLAVLLGGMWIANLFYWGCNQYIIQRALAAKSLKEAQRGLVFAAYLKLLLPVIVVLPGIVAYALHNGAIERPDEAYPWLLGQYLGPGLKGLAFAALVAAIVSSLASMMNSTSTIFTMDLHRNLFRPQADERELVRVGRIVGLSSICVAAVIAPQLGRLDQAFQYIQEYTGFISPGVLAIFVMGLFWRKATANAALLSALLSIPLSAGIKVLIPAMPFLDRMMWVFIISVVLIVVVSYLDGHGEDSPHAVRRGEVKFIKDPVFLVAAFGVLMITTAIYALWW